MQRRLLVIWALLACFALFVAAGSEMLHQHDGLAGDAACPSCAAALFAVLAPATIALKRAADERPRVHRALALVWPATRTPYRLAARGPPAR